MFYNMYPMLERLARDKLSFLLWKFSFITLAPVASFTPHHFLHNLQMGPISWCVCPLQTLPPSVMKQAIFYSFVLPGNRAPQSASPRRLSTMTRASTRRPRTKWPWNCSQALLRSGLGKFKISLCLFICPSVNLSVFLFICPSIHLSICLSVCLSFR